MQNAEKKYNCILLVDDDDTSNYISKKVIDGLGIAQHTHVMCNGKQALDYIANQCAEKKEDACPDIILLDINMPVMDGFQFLEAFFKNSMFSYDAVKIVMLTSSVNPKDVELSRQYPIHGYISKPVTSEKLKQALVLLS